MPNLLTCLSCLFLGVTLANLSPDKEEIGHEVFENFETAVFAIFFTLAGMELEFDNVGKAGRLKIRGLRSRGEVEFNGGRNAKRPSRDFN